MSTPMIGPLHSLLPGQVIPAFTLRTNEGEKVRSLDYPGFRLILIFTGESNRALNRQFLRQIRRLYPALRAEGADALVVAPFEVDFDRFLDPGVKVPFPVLRDPNSMVHGLYGALDWGGRPALSVFITNRMGRVLFRSLTGLREDLPSNPLIIDFLNYDQIACHYCAAPLWLR